MNLLFITRKYPPMVGGMEKMSHALAIEFQKNANTTLITWGKSQKFLLYFVIKAFFQSIYFIHVKKIDRIHLGDGLLAPIGLVLKCLFKIRTTVSIAGLDVTFKFPPYQFLIPKCVAKLDKVICISNATLEECVKRGIPREKCVFIPCGIYPDEYQTSASRKDLEKIVGINLENKKVLVTVGRLVPRKGVFWFIQNVVPKLEKHYLYLVIGDGPEKDRIISLIRSHNLERRVLILGKVSDQQLKIIYNTSDIFIMPNIPVDNDIEGFGIVALEAAISGMPVVASNLSGIKDAVKENKTGKLVTPKNPDLFYKNIHHVNLLKRTEIAEYVRRHYSWLSTVRKIMNA